MISVLKEQEQKRRKLRQQVRHRQIQQIKNNVRKLYQEHQSQHDDDQNDGIKVKNQRKMLCRGCVEGQIKWTPDLGFVCGQHQRVIVNNLCQYFRSSSLYIAFLSYQYCTLTSLKLHLLSLTSVLLSPPLPPNLQSHPLLLSILQGDIQYHLYEIKRQENKEDEWTQIKIVQALSKQCIKFMLMSYGWKLGQIGLKNLRQLLASVEEADRRVGLDIGMVMVGGMEDVGDMGLYGLMWKIIYESIHEQPPKKTNTQLLQKTLQLCLSYLQNISKFPHPNPHPHNLLEYLMLQLKQTVHLETETKLEIDHKHQQISCSNNSTYNKMQDINTFEFGQRQQKLRQQFHNSYQQQQYMKFKERVIMVDRKFEVEMRGSGNMDEEVW